MNVSRIGVLLVGICASIGWESSASAAASKDKGVQLKMFQPDASVEQYEAWLAKGIFAQVPRTASIDNASVLRLAKTIGQALEGFVFDDTENRFVPCRTSE